MKLRWIFLVALGHFVVTVCAVFFLLPWLFTASMPSADMERQMRIWQAANAVLAFPVGLLQWGVPFLPWVINSLFWGWALVAFVALIRRRPAPTTAGALTDRTIAGITNVPRS